MPAPTDHNFPARPVARLSRWPKVLVAALAAVGVFALIRAAVACCEGGFFLVAALELLGCLVCLALAIGLWRAAKRLDAALTESETRRRQIERAESQLRDSLNTQEVLTQRERTMRRELDHRVRNNLAALLGLIRLYRRSGESGAGLTQVESKLHAMREVHEMLATADQQDVDLAALARRLGALMIGDAASGAVIIRSHEGAVSAAQAAPLAIILQELFTNSLKHGALRPTGPEGRVEIAWRPTDAGFTLSWREFTARDPGPLPAEGFGTALIRGFARSELQGECDFEMTPDGLLFELRAGVRLIFRPPAAAAAAATTVRGVVPAASATAAVLRAREE